MDEEKGPMPRHPKVAFARDCQLAVMLMVLLMVICLQTVARAQCSSCDMRSASLSASWSKVGYKPLNSATTIPALLYIQVDYFYTLNENNSYDTANDHSYNDTYEHETDAYNINSNTGPFLKYWQEVTRAGSFWGNDTCSGSALWDDTSTTNGCTGNWSIVDDCGTAEYGDCDDKPPFDTGNFADYSSSWTTVLDILTTTADETRWVADVDDGSVAVNDMEDETTVLSQLYTDEMLRGRILNLIAQLQWPAKTNYGFGSSSASYMLSSDHINGSGAEMNYYIEVPDSETNTIYTVTWQEETIINSTNISFSPLTEDITGTGDPTNAACGIMHFVSVPGQVNCEITETGPVISNVRPANGGSGGGNSPAAPPPGTGRFGPAWLGSN